MIRRAPLLTTAAASVALVVTYSLTARPLKDVVSETWYREVERRRVSDRAELFPPGEGRHLGMYRPELPWELESFFAHAEAIGIAPRIVAYYQAWGEGPEHDLDVEAVASLTAAGYVPMITWEPWLTDFGARSRREPFGSLLHIVDGEFDDYLREYARASVRARRPFLLRPLHEIGNPAYPWSTANGNPPELVAEAFRHLVDIFRAEGAGNVAFVWSPYTPEDVAAWPGDAWVDAIGLDLFNYGTTIPGGGWTPFATLLDWHLGAASGRHPVLLAEVGCADRGGERATWWREAFATLASPRYEQVRAVVVYDHPGHRVADGVWVDWGPFRDPASVAGVKAMVPGAGFESTVAGSRR